jgi:hypothetical protein
MYKSHLLILFFCLFAIAGCRKDRINVPVWDESLSVERNVANYAIPLQDSLNFSFLDKIAASKSVIIIGEKGHYDQVSATTKCNMINYLSKKGFRSVALEATPFLATYLFGNPEYKNAVKTWKLPEFWGFPGMNKNNEPLLIPMSNGEIRPWGIDTWNGGIFDFQAVQEILQRYSKRYNYKEKIPWERYYHLLYKTMYRENSISEYHEYMRIIDKISNTAHYLITKHESSDDLKAILQWIRNKNTQVAWEEDPESHLSLRNRDMQMAENILWIVQNFPDEKLIVSCANFHGAKDISQTTYLPDSLFYFRFQSMGETLYDRLGDKMYSLALTYPEKEEAETGELEKQIALATGNASFAFVDFEPLRFAEGFRDQEFDAAMIIKKRGKWLHIFDGIYYIRDEERKVIPLKKPVQRNDLKN